METRTTIEVECTTLDTFCEMESIERVSALKLDVQGAELRVLGGATKLLRERRIDLIYTELQFADLYVGQAPYYAVCKLLEEVGFSLFRLFDVRYTDQGHLGWGDALFVQR